MLCRTVIELRPMTEGDLGRVAGWLRQPHVARWWLFEATAADELEKLRARVAGTSDRPTRLLTILQRAPAPGALATPVGWCQWYPYDAYPDEAVAIGALPGECGIDYAIGDPSAVGRGLGTELIAALVGEVRRHHPGCGVIVDPDARNRASRRVLERNGFALVAVRALPTEPTDDPMAIYRLRAGAP
jgi:aminoglycoside 6'-N-acetyltransferase